MADRKRLADVFQTVGLPKYTYVKPTHYGEVRADIEQPGKHLLIEGPSGIGKTCVVFKVFEELGWSKGKDYAYITCRDTDAFDVLDDFLATAVAGDTTQWPLLVVDDFHLLPTNTRAEVGGYLKRLSDQIFSQLLSSKVALIGIPATGMSLLREAYDLGPRLGAYRLSRASDAEIAKLIAEGEEALNVLFDDDKVLLSEIDGNFWLGQYVCNKICATNEVFETCETTEVLSYDLLGIRKRLMDELSPRYMPIATVFSKGRKWRPGGNKPYLEVFLSLTKIPESVITFDKILNLVPERRKPGIKAIRPRIGQAIHDPSRNVDLRKHIAFDSDCFSIEDPLFRYFLSYLDQRDLCRSLGIEPESIERDKLYPYDVGFSFAGEVRSIVELVNENLKEEDVVTFYDFDQQAFLLAVDLETTLSRIYSVACRFYLVFMDANYKAKVWTKFEREIMTRPGRSNHIIPVILDDEGLTGTPGIASSIGRIDLRDIWGTVSPTGKFDRETRNVIRNRCALPILQKLDTPESHARP